jgi:hypothetical protein
MRTFLVLLAVLSAAVAGNAARAAEIEIPPHLVQARVDNTTVPVPVSGQVALNGAGAAVEAEVTLAADLRPVQERLTPILRARLDRDETCGDKVIVHDGSLVPVPPAVRMATRLTYGRFVCVGQGDQRIRARLFEDTATVTIEVTPSVRDGRAVVGVRIASIEAREPLRSLLNNPKLLQPAADRIAAAAVKEIERMVPAAVRRLGPVYRAVAFTALADGGLGLGIVAAHTATRAEIAQLAAALAATR